jgi:hypothetical protein
MTTRRPSVRASITLAAGRAATARSAAISTLNAWRGSDGRRRGWRLAACTEVDMCGDIILYNCRDLRY